MSGRRMALAALSALAATTVFTVPAGATVFNQGISVHPRAHLAQDGSVTLSGSYHCEQASPVGAMQIKATLVQDGIRLSLGADEVVCDGKERTWVAHAPASFVHVQPGHARVTGEIQEVRLSGFMPRSVTTVAQDSKDVEVREGH
ncbi:DUF6299 family protein [Streptomyces sp. NPDC048357]|uniref:DUF6299 family protein n=1 Tax=Streptomyces sp. NPDC048357 TaxID=3154719 RepID=UPI00343415F1